MLWLLLRVVLLVAVIGGAIGWVMLGVWRARRARRTLDQADRAFRRRDDRLAEQFRLAADATGKPRGLRWKRCELADAAPLLARDKATGELVALCGVTIAFEAIEGGGMEEVEAVGLLRDATAVFHWRDGQWLTDGRAVFNCSPEQTLERYRQSLVAV